MKLLEPSKKEKQYKADADRWQRIAADCDEESKKAKQTISQLQKQHYQDENKRKKLASDALRHGSSEGGRQMQEWRKSK